MDTIYSAFGGTVDSSGNNIDGGAPPSNKNNRGNYGGTGMLKAPPRGLRLQLAQAIS